MANDDKLQQVLANGGASRPILTDSVLDRSVSDWDSAGTSLAADLLRQAQQSGPSPTGFFDPTTGRPVTETLTGPQAGPAAPPESMRSRVLTGLAQMVINGLQSYGRGVEDPRIAMQRRGQDVQMAEVMARLQEAAAYHQGILGQRERSTDVREDYYQGRLNEAAQRMKDYRSGLSQRITASLANRGYAPQWDEDGNFAGIRPLTQDELSEQAKSGIGLNASRSAELGARAGEETARGQYYRRAQFRFGTTTFTSGSSNVWASIG